MRVKFLDIFFLKDINDAYLRHVNSGIFMSWESEIRKETQDKFLQDLVSELQSADEEIRQSIKRLNHILLSPKYALLLKENEHRSGNFEKALL